MISPVECAELVAVKLCHDLAGPIGAINNGVELLHDEDTEFLNESLNLVEMSAKEAVHKIMYYRQAYGSISKENEINLNNLRDLITNFFSQTKCQIDWALPESQTTLVPSATARILLNLLLIASSTLITGGTITIQLTRDLQKIPIRLHAKGPMVKLADETLALLTLDKVEFPITVKNIQPFLTTQMLKMNHETLSVHYKPQELELITNS